MSTDEKSAGVTFAASDVDTAATHLAESDVQLDSAEGERVRRKIDRYIMPLMCTVYWVQFMDKTVLGSSTLLGLVDSTHLSATQYNWLGTVFYLAYLVFEYPQNLALQRFPLAKWMSLNIAVWAIALMCHAACTDFKGLFIVRFILGACEGSTTAGFILVSSMWYNRREQTLRVGYWFMMTGVAEITSGFLSFGILHLHTPGFKPWQWLMVITGSITLITAIAFWLLFPDSPSNAWFLTPDERTIAVQRIRENQTGLENKRFKNHQAIEALQDPKTWIFFVYSVLHNIPTSLTNQRQPIIASFGFTNLETTLLGSVSGLVLISSTLGCTNITARVPNSRAYVAAASYIPNIIAGLLILFLPWSNKPGLLVSLWLTSFATAGYVISLAWIISVTCGHTKRITTNAIALIGYCCGNALGPFMWEQQYKPRNRVPWGVIVGCYISCVISVLALRSHLARENNARDREVSVTDDFINVYVTKEVDGSVVKFRVEKEFLDLTDKQNKDFRYVL